MLTFKEPVTRLGKLCALTSSCALIGASMSTEVYASSQAATCLTDSPVEIVRVLRVTDGDTIVLQDQRRVRIIGINTLELNSQNPTNRHLAQLAKASLENFLIQGSPVLVQGVDTHDRHGRALAHVRLSNGQDAAQTLIEQGLGLAVGIGENTRCADTLAALEQRARDNARGLWRQPGNWYLDVDRLSGTERGFHVVKSVIGSVLGNGSGKALALSNGLHVKLGDAAAQLEKESGQTLESWIGQSVEVRGWLSSRNGRTSLTLHHAGNLRRLGVNH